MVEIEGEVLWNSRRLGDFGKDSFPALAYSWLLPLAGADGSFEADPEIVWRKCFARFPSWCVTVAVVAQLFELYEAAGLLFRWGDTDGRIFGCWQEIAEEEVMYGKIFKQMYEGTLVSRGSWQALITFQQFIVLANRHGEVDMTPEAISRLTTIPLDVIQAGISALEKPDPESRTPDKDGRRIVRLDGHRSWGWRLVNYEKYRKITSEEDRREYQAKWIAAKREKQGQSTKVDSRRKSTESTQVEVEVEVESQNHSADYVRTRRFVTPKPDQTSTLRRSSASGRSTSRPCTRAPGF